MAIVYIHRRNDINDTFSNVFYVGIGLTENRANEKTHSRNSLWKNIVRKCNYSVEILHQNISIEEAKILEKKLIKYYGRKDLNLGNLCNMTDGGDGVINWSDELKEKHKIIQKEINQRPERKVKLREIAINLRKNKKYCENVSNGLKNVLGTVEMRKANSERKLQYYSKKENIENHKILMKKIHSKPEEVEKNRQRAIKQWSDPEARKRMSLIKIEYYKNKKLLNKNK